MYNTLYEITRNSYLKNIFISGEKIFFIGFIVFVCIVFYLNYSLKKLCKEENIPIQELKEDEIYKKIRLLKYISIVLLPIFVILCISSIPEDIAVRDYVYNQYKSGNFHVAEGKVEKYEVYYTGKNDTDFRNVKFEIDGIKFDLNNTYNFGYNETSAANCLIKSNGQNIKITYLLEDDFDPNFGIKSNKYESYDEYIKNGETGLLSPISILFDEDTKIAIVKIEEYK